MILVGEYTHLPDWLPTRPGSGILALERGADGSYQERGVCGMKNPSYLVPGGGGSLYAVEEGSRRRTCPAPKNAGRDIRGGGNGALSGQRQLPHLPELPNRYGLCVQL